MESGRWQEGREADKERGEGSGGRDFGEECGVQRRGDYTRSPSDL